MSRLLRGGGELTMFMEHRPGLATPLPTPTRTTLRRSHRVTLVGPFADHMPFLGKNVVVVTLRGTRGLPKPCRGVPG